MVIMYGLSHALHYYTESSTESAHALGGGKLASVDGALSMPVAQSLVSRDSHIHECPVSLQKACARPTRSWFTILHALKYLGISRGHSYHPSSTDRSPRTLSRDNGTLHSYTNWETGYYLSTSPVARFDVGYATTFQDTMSTCAHSAGRQTK